SRARAGQPVEAASDLRQAIELWAKSPAADIEAQFELSRVLALLAGLSADAKSGVTASDSEAFANQAMAALQDAINADWALPNKLKDSDFDPLRERADFKKLLADLEKKAKTAANAP